MNWNAKTIRESGFYSDSKWLKMRDEIRTRDKMTCQRCGTFSADRYEVDHIIELNWDNIHDWNITWNPENLQLLCHDCHTKKTREDKKDNERLFF
jgi:5-methylcytosine-specific restriction endonuclease McrA